MKNIKEFKQFESKLTKSTVKTYDEQKENLLKSLEQTIALFDEYTKLISPSFWRSSGTVFMNLNNAKEEVERYKEATLDELNNIDTLNDNTDDDLFNQF